MSNDNELWHLFAVEAMNSEILWAIRNMDILKNCWECLMLDGERGTCKILNSRSIEMSRTDSREEDCPLVEVPSRHGRVIDTDTKRARNCYDVWLYWLGQDRLIGELMRDRENEHFD